MEKVKYQVVLLDLKRGHFSAANGSGMTAQVFNTYEEAINDLQSWTLMFSRTQPSLRLAVQEVRCVVVSDSIVGTDGKPVEQYDTT